MQAYVTLLTNDDYASGALVLAHSLRASQTTKHLAVLTTTAVSKSVRDRLANVFDSVIEIGEIDSHAHKQLELLGRPELGITLTKIHVFNQTQFDKVVFLDADTLILRNVDHLFDTAANGSLDDEDHNTRFAASPDAGWPDCFNSGVFVCRPKYEDYRGLIELANKEGYAPAYQQYKDRLAIVHFIGRFKPWHWLRFADGQVFPRNHASKDSIDLVQKWWAIWDKFVGGKPSDIHEVTHEGYAGELGSQWDSIGLDRQPFTQQHDKPPHYDGWFAPYDMTYTQKSTEHSQHGQDEYKHHDLQQHHHDSSQQHTFTHEQHQETHQQQQQQHHQFDGHREEHHHHHEHRHQEQDRQDHSTFHQEEHHHHHKWYPPMPPRMDQHIHRHEEHKQHQQQHQQQEQHHHQHHVYQQDHSHGHGHHDVHHHHGAHETQQNGHHHHEQHKPHVPPPRQEPPSPIQYNPHHLTDYHYYIPPPPPKVPEIPEPPPHSFDTDEYKVVEKAREQQSQKDEDISTNPHHLTDYHYRLPAVLEKPAVSIEAASTLQEIIPPPKGLPDLYYENAWDKPEDPRKMYPVVEPVSVVVLSTEEQEASSPYPSGKTHPVFPWESVQQSSQNETQKKRVTRKYYNYTAHQEARARQREQEMLHRLELEEAALAKIQREERERFERERAREEAQTRETGHHTLENFRLVNAWDIDVGVQMSILKKTEHKQQRKSRSRKNSGALRRGYTLEDMLSLEARQRQEQYDAEIERLRIQEEERFLREQEEARIMEEAARAQKQRLAERRARESQARSDRTSSTSSSQSYAFRNAWDPPGMELRKKKLSIEDEEVEMALPLRPQRGDSSRNLTFASFSGTGSQHIQDISDGRVSIEAAIRGSSRTLGAGATGISMTSAKATMSRGSGSLEGARGRSQSTTLSAAHQTVEGRKSASSGSSGSASIETMVGGVRGATSSSGTSTALTTTQTTTKMTPPGAIRFVKTTTTTTITRRKIVNGVVVETTTTTNTTGDMDEWELPPGPRELPYFKGGHRSASITRSQTPSRLGAGGQSTTTTTHTSTSSSLSQQLNVAKGDGSGLTEANQISHQHGTIPRSSDTTGFRTTSSWESSKKVDTMHAASTRQTTRNDTIRQHAVSNLVVDTKLAASATTTGTSEGLYESITRQRESKAVDRDIQRTSPQELRYSQTKGRTPEREWLDLGKEEGSTAAVEKSREILSKNPRATSISTKWAGKSVDLYADDPILQSATATAPTNLNITTKGNEWATARREEDVTVETTIEEDLDDLDYFGEQHTHAVLPMGSPYMPSTPLLPHMHPRYAFSESSSRTASRPVSRPSTPGSPALKSYDLGVSKRGASTTSTDLWDRASTIHQAQRTDNPPISLSTTSTETFSSKKALATSGFSSMPLKDRRQSSEPDVGFSNYRIEWNWSELLGKKPRHWNDEEGNYDPYNALSTHGSMIDSEDEDDHQLLDSSSEEEDEEDVLSSSASSSRNRFAQGEDHELARESEFVIRDGKIARRRSSMALERRNL
ncbi:Glycogenin-1 [Actinomortierella wolfii]|nr:Glycogenin-1 [Actinomortierella wolfii]